jgi:hypothetical protein
MMATEPQSADLGPEHGPAAARTTPAVTPGLGTAPIQGQGKAVLVALAAIVVLVAANWIAFIILRASDTGGVLPQEAAAFDSFYDGCLALSTLALPSLLGGLLIGYMIKGRALTVALPTYALAAVVGFVHPYWHVAMVAQEAVHSGAMHYLLHNPLVILACGTFGAWLAGEFAIGRFTLADRQPVDLRGMED